MWLYYCGRQSRHVFTGKLTLTLMILLLKLFSTTIMSSESAGESVPSWLQQKKGTRKTNELKKKIRTETYRSVVSV